VSGTEEKFSGFFLTCLTSWKSAANNSPVMVPGSLFGVPRGTLGEQIRFREAMWRPERLWHWEQLQAIRQTPQLFATQMRHHLLHRATSEQHLENHRFDEAFHSLIAAELVKPQPRRIDWPELLGMPKER
jgi:hypothetical protein